MVAVDLPGHGQSFKDMNVRYDIDDQVRYLNTILGKLNVDRFHIAGNSMGGAISALYAATYPEKVASLVLLNPAGISTHRSQMADMLDRGENPLVVSTDDDFFELMDFAMEKKPFIPWPVSSVLAEKAVADKAIRERFLRILPGIISTTFKTRSKQSKLRR